MEDFKKLFLFLTVVALFTSGAVATNPVFADDDDKKDKNDKKEKLTKLQKECAKEPKKPHKIKPECELLNLINDSAPDPRADSFFDVFFDIELYNVDSFFDIFTELQNSSAQSDSFFDVFFDIDVGATTPDSFFDIFVDVDTGARPDSFFDIFVDLHDTDETIQTELVALDLRGESCPDGEILTGIAVDGMLVCTPAETGGNPFTDIQQNIDDKNSELLQIQADMSSVSFGIANFQNQLDALVLSPQEQHACMLQCAINPGQPCSCTFSDPTAASALIQQISDLQLQLDLLNEQLVDCQFELMVLQTLQNQLDNSGDPTPDCNDANLCTIDFFDSTTGMCANLPNDGLSCNDGDVTTQSDMCTASMCEGTPIICDDGNPETADSIDLLTGECIFTLIDNDGDGFGPSVDCDDGDPAVNPNAVEIIGDGIDNNCDGITDNLPPFVDAGLVMTDSQGGQDGCTATFVGTANDPDGDTLTIQWTSTNQGSRVIFDSQNSLTTGVFFDPVRDTISNTAVLQLSISDGLHSVSDTTQLICNP